jgi:hypothetical protein
MLSKPVEELVADLEVLTRLVIFVEVIDDHVLHVRNFEFVCYLVEIEKRLRGPSNMIRSRRLDLQLGNEDIVGW